MGSGGKHPRQDTDDCQNGVTSFEQLAQALPLVSGSASQLGVSMDELMAVFATTTGVTGNTAEVSTQLAAVLNSLIKPSAEATKAANEMGIGFNAASIQAAGGLENFLLGLDASIQEYAAKTGQLSQTIYGQLFGSAEAMRLLGSLTGEQKRSSRRTSVRWRIRLARWTRLLTTCHRPGRACGWFLPTRCTP